MPTLFSYGIPFDDGAAPNPFWGRCTLAICKPVIRRTAKIGDWVPSARPSGTSQTMKEYDQFTRSKLPNKIPQIDQTDPRRWYGDSIYDFSTATPSLRPSVHSEKNRRTDLSGEQVLLSDSFFSFGDRPSALQQQQGHRSRANAGYFDAFVDWIERLKSEYPFAVPFGHPQWWSLSDFQASCESCTSGRLLEAEADVEVSDAPLSHPC